ncbi:hypothetical protein E2C01_033785 [Portunus trituberculatus]|uniref:Uncharacterized protein n=1 Tax=Portunus trituberculatus TaxID=210409 RepID=A0A5B7F4P3_PORTR|nr:hypothetical protein [Portunus trituberculatus]
MFWRSMISLCLSPRHFAEGEELDLREQERSLNLPAISPSSGSRGDSHVYLLAGLAGTACLLWARCF